jgi:hypothetical protein
MTVLLRMTLSGAASKGNLSLAEWSFSYQLRLSLKPSPMHMEICWSVMMASTKQRSAFYNVSTGLAWTPTLLPTSSPATDVNFAAKMTDRRPPYSPHCLNPLSQTKECMQTCLAP